MSQRKRWVVTLMLALGTVGWFAAGASRVRAATESNRAETWEFMIPVRYLPGYSNDFDGGSSIEINDDIGWGFGLGYNFNEHLNLDFEFAWTSANYKATIASSELIPQADWKANGTLDATSSTFNLTYNFMSKTFTPYISLGVGWSWVDSNIANGPPDTYCWWDPWYGNICGSYYDTYSASGFSYGFGAGLRFEPKESFFLRVGINDNWQDYGSYSNTGTPDFLSYRIDMGWKF
jgi:opacity protein-like surface antigen